MHHRPTGPLRSGFFIAVLAAACLAPAAVAAPVEVTVRVEGSSQTVFPETKIATDARTLDKGDGPHACDGTSASPPKPSGATPTGALDDASRLGGFTWDASYYGGFGDFLIGRIGPDSGTSAPPYLYWGVKVNNADTTEGGCQVRLQRGDDVLWYFTDGSLATLDLEAPARAPAGSRASVTVRAYDYAGGATPVQGATVAGGVAPAMTGAGGTATVRLGGTGTAGLRAEKAGSVRSRTASVCLYERDSGQCGTADRVVAAGRISSIATGFRFRRGRGPRLLAGSVPTDQSGIAAVELSLRRHLRGRCKSWNATRERFAGRGCLPYRFFSVGDRAQWSYLLPRRLRRGHYVLDLRVLDRAGNRSRGIERGRNRVVFDVR